MQMLIPPFQQKTPSANTGGWFSFELLRGGQSRRQGFGHGDSSFVQSSADDCSGHW